MKKINIRAGIFLVILAIIVSICIMRADKSLENVIHDSLSPIDEDYEVHDIVEYKEYRFVAFTCNKDELGYLLIEKISDRKYEVVTSRIEEKANYLLEHYSTENFQMACVVSNGTVSRMVAASDRGEPETFILDKEGISCYIFPLQKAAAGVEYSWEYSFFDSNNNLIAKKEQNSRVRLPKPIACGIIYPYVKAAAAD